MIFAQPFLPTAQRRTTAVGPATLRAGITVELLAVVCFACGGTSERSEWRLMASEGTMEGVPQLHAEPEMRIDGYAADLGPISWLGVGPTGTIAILQTQDHVVRFFDSAGSPVGSVGGDGEGPGEFRTLQRGGWKADTLWVSDFALHRVTLISPEVAFLRTLLVPSEVRSWSSNETPWTWRASSDIVSTDR